MDEKILRGKTILVTGAARRVGRLFALACGRAGAEVIIHHHNSQAQALGVMQELAQINCSAHILQADLSDPQQAAQLIERANAWRPLYGLVNSAAIFENLTLQATTLENWNQHLAINLTAPFLLSQAFANQIAENEHGRIVNILDWRALRPQADHFPYTVSKSALAALTKSLAVALAPRITVNGLALGAILPPVDDSASDEVLKNVPAQRWSASGEIESALIFLLSSAAYTTGEIIHIDGGRHLV